jgi:hypothetical protein
MMRRKLRAITLASGAVLPVLVLSQWAQANSGIQLPLSQYQAGSEITTPVTNGGFEADGMSVAVPTGWTRVGTGMTVQPVYNAPPLNPAAVGAFSAQTISSGANEYDQTVTGLAAGRNYIISAYVWNSGRYDMSGTASGDLTTVKIVNSADSTQNVSMILEAQGTNGAAGSTGRFMYLLFNQSNTASWASVNLQLISETGSIPGTLPNPWGQYDNVAITPAENFVAQKWLSNVSGNWTDDSKWLGGVNPNAQSSTFVTSNHAVASFTDGITSNQTITVDAPRTVGIINFNNALASYTIAGTNAITLDITVDGFGNTQGVPEISVLSGSHTISAPINLPRSTMINVGPSSSVLTLSGTVSSSGVTLNKIGAGTVEMNNVRAAALNVNGGTVKIRPGGNSNASASNVTALTIAGATDAWTAKLDLNDNSMVVDYTGSSPFATIQNQLKQGYANGAWTGNGISSAAATAASSTSTRTALGYAEASEVFTSFPATFKGQTVDNTSVLIRYTLSGDADLNGTVDTVDFNLLAVSFSQTGKDWYHGDFDFSNTVDTIDFNLLASNFSKSIAGSNVGSLVPEPSILGLLAAVPLCTTRRRKARRGDGSTMIA